jgi:hypothetical protein
MITGKLLVGSGGLTLKLQEYFSTFGVVTSTEVNGMGKRMINIL